MTIQVFWFIGLVAIGFVTFLFNKSISAVTTKGQNTQENIVYWGALMATVWIIFGVIFVSLKYTIN